ncbi:MAG: asparagine synthetase B (glutamine-hydrolyzing) [Verrucomicrobiales bacterium]
MNSTEDTQTCSVPLIPLDQRYLVTIGADSFLREKPCSATGELDLRAICVYLATGIFLGTDTFFKDLHTVEPGTKFKMSRDGKITGDTEVRKRWAPEEQAKIGDDDQDSLIDEMEAILADCIDSKGQQRMIGLSGGLDSRTLAGTIGVDPSVQSYSYEFEGGRDENCFGREIAIACGFEHREHSIPTGYLWRNIDRIIDLTACYAEFTHPRQLAITDSLPGSDVSLILGHWGDVIFDDFGVDEDLGNRELADFLQKMLIKSSGLTLAQEIWKLHFSDSFDTYLSSRLEQALSAVGGGANDRLRGFKSLNWAHRWTSVNLSVFGANGAKLKAPFYDERLVELSWKLPQRMLKGRKFQVEYIKRTSPALARIPWQSWEPFNLYTYENYRSLSALPVRIGKKLSRNIKRLRDGKRVRQNWENQFLGDENAKQLQRWLKDTPELTDIVPGNLVEETHAAFLGDPRGHWHGVSMLLTLAVFSKNLSRWVDGK